MKRITSLLMTALLLISAFCMAACGGSSETEEETLEIDFPLVPAKSGNVLMSESTSQHLYDVDYILRSKYESSDITSVTFLNTLSVAPSDAWDVSEAKDKSVMAWVKENERYYYDLYIAGEGGVDANPDSSYLFSFYERLNNIEFNNCFYTGNVSNMNDLFYGCKSLRSLDISNWDTSNVTTMKSMFEGCEVLEDLNVSGWDTSSVLDMSSMFRCEELKSLDLSGWDFSSAGGADLSRLSTIDRQARIGALLGLSSQYIEFGD